jgi:hypothetical protein
VLTDLKYAIDRLTFSPGEGEAAFWDKIEEVAKRMVKSRHSSTHFFQASWTAVIKKLFPFVPRPYGGMGSSSFRNVPDDLGEVVPAGSGEPRVTCVISNKLGLDDRYPSIVNDPFVGRRPQFWMRFVVGVPILCGSGRVKVIPSLY